MEKISCELCSKPARMYCDSDQARLCWDCDEKVHRANFLVAKHSRCLLCHVCQSPTPWKASGTKLGPTISLCESCFDHASAENPGARMRRRGRHEQVEEAGVETESLDDHDLNGTDQSENDDEYSDTEDEYDEDEEEDDDGENDEDGENQVVPWSSSCPTPSSSAPHNLTTSSSSEHGSFSTRDGAAAVSSALKRSRDNRHLDSDDEDDVCCSSQVDLNMGPTESEEVELRRNRRRRMEVMGSFMNFQQTAPRKSSEGSPNSVEMHFVHRLP